MKFSLSNLKNKNPKKLLLGLVPILALTAGTFFGVDDVTGLETALTGLVTAVFAVLGSLGVISNNDKSEQEKQAAANKKAAKERAKRAKG